LLYFVFTKKHHLSVLGFAGLGFDFNAAAFPFPHKSHKSMVPNIFSPAYPLAAYIHKLTHHIREMFLINVVAVISNLSCLILLTYVHFSTIIPFFFRVPINVLFRIPGGAGAN